MNGDKYLLQMNSDFVIPILCPTTIYGVNLL